MYNYNLWCIIYFQLLRRGCLASPIDYWQ